MDNNPTSNIPTESEQFYFFWHGPFSQWYGCQFTDEDITFNCAEQYTMYRKAILFGDHETAKKILEETSPREQKKLGREVKGFDSKIWDAECDGIVLMGNALKFKQNPELLKLLKDTAPKILVEASPFDKIWGIGLEAVDPRAKKKETWLGQNRLGYILTSVRDTLKYDAIKSPQPGKGTYGQRQTETDQQA